MNHLFFNSLTKDPEEKTGLEDKAVNPTPFPLHEAVDYTSEGSEFLDDAIRMKDQPLMYVDESEGAGRQEDIL